MSVPTCRSTTQGTPSGTPATGSELKQAAALHADGQLREAITLYLTIINAAPEDPKTGPVYELLGDVFYEQHDVPRALECYRRSVKLQPSESNRRKFDDMIDLSRELPRKPTPSPSSGLGPLAGVQRSLAKTQPPAGEGQPPSATGTSAVSESQYETTEASPSETEDQLIITSEPESNTGTPQPVKPIMFTNSAALQPFEARLPAGDTPLPVVNLPFPLAGTDADVLPSMRGSLFSLPDIGGDLESRNRTFLLLGVAVVALITSGLLTAQPWAHVPTPMPNKVPIALGQTISAEPLPDALGSASASGFSLLTQQPKTVGAPEKGK